LFVKTYSKYLRLTDYREWTGSELHNLLCNLGIRPFRQTDKKLLNYFFEDKGRLKKKYLDKKTKVKKIISACGIYNYGRVGGDSNFIAFK
jgi:hypothetical protein